MIPKVIVFDHAKHTNLWGACETLGFGTLSPIQTGDAKDTEAAAMLLDGRDWNLAFVHINDGPWRKLCSEATKERVIVRFSTDEFPPSGPEGEHALCIRCIKKIKDLSNDDLILLRKALLEPSVLDDLRSGSVPGELRPLLCFESPHYIRALHIISQVALAVWAGNPAHRLHKDALGTLRLETLPIGRPTTQLTRGMFRAAIGEKPKIPDRSGDKELRAFVEDLYSSEATTTLPDEDKLLAAFKTIDERLGM